VLNAFTEHDFRDAFEEQQKRWGLCILAEGDYWQVGPKLVFDQMAAPVPVITNGAL
jgi:hypothetical protein